MGLSIGFLGYISTMWLIFKITVARMQVEMSMTNILNSLRKPRSKFLKLAKGKAKKILLIALNSCTAK